MAETWKQWEGTTVDGKFRLERFLGGSDHSAVFLTEAGTPPAKAAIKFVPAIPQALEFHRSTWEQTSRLSHPNLIRVFGSGQCRLGNVDLLYVVMEYAEENLGQILPDRALSADEARDTLGPVLETLKYLHEKKLAHGSLKPSNIMAVQDQLKLSSDQVRGFGKVGLSSDTSVFAAPEMASQGAAAASDVWSLGATLVEVLTQRVPERISPRQLVVPGSLPEPFREIAGACLMELPPDRWSVAQIAERLANSPSSTVPVEPPSAKVPVASSSAQSANRVARPHVPVPSETVREQTPLKLGSRPKLIVSGISFLLVLVAIYAGTQLFHRGSHDNAAASAPESTNSSHPGASDHSTATPSSAYGKGDASKSAADSPIVAPGAASASVSSSSGRVLGRVEPEVSASSRATITGKIHVRVGLRVDPSGKVAEARFISAGPSKYFASHALEAARRWTFAPPQAEGQPIASKWTLTFTFTRKGVDSSAQAD